MSKTVKLDEERKRKLERLLARLRLEKGEKISFQEALGKAVDRALEDDQFLEELADLPPLEQDPSWRMLDEPKSWGVEDSSKKVDEHLYGGD